MNVLPPENRTFMTERRVGLIGAFMVAVGPVSMALYTPAMPEIVDAFGTTEAAVKLTLSLYFAGFAFSQLICGPMSDGFGRKPIIIAFMTLYLAASVVALFAPNVEILIAARFFQGAGAAVGIAISRALIRDLFHNDRAARIMNLQAIILAVGPALSPTLGGIIMELAGWHAIFLVMVAMGLGVILVSSFGLRETVPRDLSRIRPRALVSSYATLLGSGYFMLSSLVVAGTVGALYTLATVLPFILIDRVGLTATQFGVGMLLQSGSFFVGSLIVRRLLRTIPAARLVPVGLAFVGAGGVAIAVLLRIAPPSYLSVMGPIASYAFGIAFVMPAMMVASVAPFPRIAGSASSMSGFMQMGGGLLGGTVAALIGDPVVATATIIPAMGFIAIAAWIGWSLLPEPPGVTRIGSG
ncbi:multidrug effflux MFS transporter [Aquibium oceanicum]|uniref:Bcr/CflA family efflux transporter n=1 Tax=Aquibium oceanicum TaxID=1670800 RepID=A0A1L3SLQ8_9HYPH|nr:multidrug effflux MFS transporter [Aquibium oceanicum]APH70242.1 Bcr/CflA family drug resistance efflux transporter [Aquibium oceanicum]